MISSKAGLALVALILCVGMAPTGVAEKRSFASYAEFIGYNDVASLTPGEVYHITGDGISGEFVLRDDADSNVSITDDATVLQHNVLGQYYLERIIIGPYNVQWWGALGNGVADDIDAIQAAIAYTGSSADRAKLWFPEGIYNVSSVIDASGYNDLILYGDGADSKIMPTGSGHDTIKIDGNDNRIELHHLNICVLDNQIGVDWEAHHGGLFNCHINPASTSDATGVTGIRLKQTGNQTGSWITSIQNCTINFDQAEEAVGCIGIEMIGSANAINVNDNTIGGFNGTGIVIEEFSHGRYPQSIAITGNTFIDMCKSGVQNIAIDVSGLAYGVYILHNHFEDILGTDSRFLRAGVSDVGVSHVRAITFAENNAYSSNARPPGFVGVELDKVVSPNIYGNIGHPAGALEYSITNNTLMGLANELDTPIRYVYDLMDSEQDDVQKPVGTQYVDVDKAREYTPVNSALPALATLEVVYEPGVGGGEEISFMLKRASGFDVVASEVSDDTGVTSGTAARKVSKLFYAGYDDLGKLQAKTSDDAGNQGWKILSARLIIHTN